MPTTDPQPSRDLGETPAAHDVHDRLREMILDGALDDAGAFSQVALAAQLGVSRTPLREALRMLEREGLVQSELNKRARVTPMSAEDLDELYGLRIMLEALAVYVTASRATTDDIEALAALLEDMETHASAGDRIRWEEPHAQFHQQLSQYGGNRLIAMASDLRDHSRRYVRRHIQEPLAWAAGSEEHHDIFDAVKRHDASLAAQKMGLHLARTSLTLIARLAPSHDAIATRGALRFVEGIG